MTTLAVGYVYTMTTRHCSHYYPEKSVCRGMFRARLPPWRAHGRARVGRRGFLEFQGDRGSLLPRFYLFQGVSENDYNDYIVYTIYVSIYVYVCILLSVKLYKDIDWI